MKENEKTSDSAAPGGTKFYRTYTDDFVESQHQDCSVPDGYTWLYEKKVCRMAAAVLYELAAVFTFFYTRMGLHIRVVNKKVLKKGKDTGYFLYGNHTQPTGDAFSPVRCVFPKRVYIVMGAANLGIPGLGKALPLLGGLVVPDSLSDMKEFIRALRCHMKQRHCIVVYPEAHVWPWCDFVRTFPDTSFRFPVMLKVPSFSMTTTYQKPRHGKKPRVTIYLDGPFFPDPELGQKEAQRKLRDDLFACMQNRSKNSTYAYVKYEKEPDL